MPSTRASGLSPAPPIEEIRLLGNRPCLDFVNTVEDRVHGTRDSLADYASLVAWAARAGAVDRDEARALRRLSEENPAKAAQSFARAIELRERLYAVFSALAGGRAAEAADLDALQATFAAAMSHARLRHSPEGVAWNWQKSDRTLERIAWEVARSAIDLLFSSQVSRVKQCPGHDCGWLFLDLSRNRSRRWCSMEGCGSRAKMRSLYQRRKTGPAPPG